MTEQHPLTDEIVEKQFGRYDGIDDVMVYDEDDIRAAYDLGVKAGRDEMRKELRELNWRRIEQYKTISVMIQKLKDHGIC